MKNQQVPVMYIKYGVIFFVYSLFAGLVIQLYLITEIFPQFNLGDGIVVLDSSGFNQIAKEKAIEIGEKGWAAWELRPKQQSPAGIASIFYSLWAPKPYSMLPFNALVHAISGSIVLWLLSRFFPWKPAVIGSAVFVLNPAAMEWVAQIHRDGIFILGNLLVLLSLIRYGKDWGSTNPGGILISFVIAISGTTLVWIARPFWVQVLFVTILIWIAMMSMHCLITAARKDAV